MTLENITVRRGKPEDIPAVHALIVELAVYEREPNAVTNTPEMMLRDGFGKHPVYGLFVAEKEGQIVGISIFYTRYSTWKGPCLYLEDIVVTEKERGKGIGDKLFRRTKKEAEDQKAPLMLWQVLDWNEPAIRFYKKYNAEFDGEWINCKIRTADTD